MAYDEGIQENTNKYSKPNRIYEDWELKEFDGEIEKFRITRNTDEWGTVSFFDKKSWFISQGAMTKDGAIIIKNIEKKFPPRAKKDEYYFDCDPISFEYLDNKLDQYLEWKGKKEYAQKMKLKQLEESI